MKAVVAVDAGICGHRAEITATHQPETGTCAVKVETSCPVLTPFAEAMQVVRPVEEVRWSSSQVHAEFRDRCPHTSCLVPVAVLKAVQVATGIKQPADASIRFVEPTAE